MIKTNKTSNLVQSLEIIHVDTFWGFTFIYRKYNINKMWLSKLLVFGIYLDVSKRKAGKIALINDHYL